MSSLGSRGGRAPEAELQTRHTAIEEFEADYGLPVTGETSGAMQGKLVEVHGS